MSGKPDGDNYLLEILNAKDIERALQFLQYNVKSVHPVSCAGIQTHDLLNASILP